MADLGNSKMGTQFRSRAGFLDSKTVDYAYTVFMDAQDVFVLCKTNVVRPKDVKVVKRTLDPEEAQQWVLHGEGFDESGWDFDKEAARERRKSLAVGLEIKEIPDDMDISVVVIPNGYHLTFLSARRDKIREVYLMKDDKREARAILETEFGVELL